VPAILARLFPDVVPEIPAAVGAVQLYKVPEGINPLVPSAGVTEKVPPLQIVVLILKTAGAGFTVTITGNVAPVQDPVIGVTI